MTQMYVIYVAAAQGGTNVCRHKTLRAEDFTVLANVS